MYKWKQVRLGDLCEVITKGSTPTTLGYSFTESGINFVKSESVTFDGWIDSSKFAFIDEVTHNALKRSQLREGDILFSMAGVYIGKTAVVPKSILPANTNQAVGIVRLNSNEAYPPFIDYFLRNPSYNLFLNNLISQSAQPNLNLAEIGNLPIRLPPLPEQKRIAHILGTLDDKIELNRRMNATLESMARALFKSWFVDFDPVRAKANGSKPEGMDTDTAALFPSTFQDSPLGPIPKGWTSSTIGDIAEVIDCLHAKKPERTDTGHPYLQLNNIRDDGLLDLSDMFLVSEEAYRKWISRMEAKAGDCVITNVGRVGAVAQIPDRVTAALGRNMTGLRCRSGFTYQTFLIECLLSQAMRDEIVRKMDSGTILDALNVKSIPKLGFTKPTAEIAKRFEEVARPLRNRMEENLRESHTLAAVRDTLLPKLLSGKLRQQGEKGGSV